MLCSLFSGCFRIALLLVFVALCLPQVQAQEGGDTAQNPRFFNLRTALNQIPYRPEMGVVIGVSRGAEITDKAPGTLRQLLTAFERKTEQVGPFTVLVPRTMVIINSKPGSAKIFANLEVHDRMKLFLASLSRDQWRIAGDTGINLKDLNPDQQEMFASFLPPADGFAVQKTELEEVPEKPLQLHYKQIGEPQPADVTGLRLKIGRRAVYEFGQVGKEDAKAISHSSDDRKPGTIFYTPVRIAGTGTTYTSAMEGLNGKDRRSAFGVPILKTVPSRPKVSEIDFTATAMDAGVMLSLDWKTLGDAINAARKATGLELYADQRVRDLPIALSADANRSVRAGDLLQALASAVTGAYRHLDGPVFVLTDDVEGIGTRLARLENWASEADSQRYKQVDESLDTMAKAVPLPFLKFFPGDENAIPPALNKRIEEEWAKNRYAIGTRVRVRDLPPNLREDVDKQARFWNELAKPPLPVNTEFINLGEEVAFQWSLPDGGKLEDTYAMNGYSIGSQFLGRLVPSTPVAPAPKPAPTAVVTKKAPLPALSREAKRRCLIISPATVDEAKQLVESATVRGFNEIWVMKTLDNADDAALKAALSASKTRHIPVYLCISAFRFAKMGIEERNILGQTGQDWFTAQRNTGYFRQHPDAWAGSAWQFERWREWTCPTDEDLAAMEKRLITLVSLPGVAGIAFKNTAAPGYAGRFVGGDGIFPNGYFGYTLPMRLAFLREHSVDPVDMWERGALRDLDADLPYFPNPSPDALTIDANGKQTEVNVPASAWRTFRYDRAAGWMKRLHTAVKEAKSDLPLYISDRASDYATPYAEWFGLWEQPEILPQNPVFAPEGEGRVLAHQIHKIVLKRGGWDKASGNKDEPEWFANSIVGKAKEAAAGYDGIVVDISQLASKDALRLLGGLAAEANSKLAISR